MNIPKIPDAAPPVVTQPRASEKAVSAEHAEEKARPTAAEPRSLAAEERARIAERLQEMARESGRALEFRVDEASDKMVIVVRDQSTGELIRQIPDATALRISQRLQSQVEAMRSVLFQGRV